MDLHTPTLTPEHVALLAQAQGLGQYVTTPTRDWLPPASQKGHEFAVVDLLNLGFLQERQIHGEGGLEAVTSITDAGRAAYQLAIEQATPAPVPDPAPAPETDANPNPSPAPRPKRQPKAKAGAAAPGADLLTGADEQPAVGGALAPITAAVDDLVAMTTPNMKATDYVATIYKPFRETLDKLVKRAAVMALTPEEFDQKTAEQALLPEDQRQEVIAVDVTTKEGMALAIEMRAGLRDDVRCAAENMRKAKKAPILEIGRELDNRYKDIEATVLPLEEKFHQAIKAEENRRAEEKLAKERADNERKAAIRAKIDAVAVLPKTLAGATSAELEAQLQVLADMEPTEAEYQEFLGEMVLTLDTVGGALATLLEGQQAREAAEAKRQREQEEERARLDAQAKQQAEAAAQLAQQQAALEEQKQAAARAQEEAAATLRRQQEQQQHAMANIAKLQDWANVSGTAYYLEHMRLQAWAVSTDECYYGMAAPMVLMAKDMAVRTLESRIAALVAQELPAAWDEAHAENEAFDAVLGVQEHIPEPQQPLVAQDEPEPAAAQVDESPDLHENKVDETANLHETAEPAPAPVPDAAPAAQVNVGSYVRPNLQHLPMEAQRADANAESHFCANLRTLLANRDPENVAALFHQQLVMAIVEKRNNWPVMK